jgi:hypothetical protein
MRKWFILLSLTLLVILFLPLIASTPFAKPFFVRALEAKTGAKLSIQALKLSWLGPQEFEGVQFEKEAVTGSIETFSIAAPFWSFSGPFDLANGEISYPGGKIEQIQGEVQGNHFTLSGVSLSGRLFVKGELYSKLHFHLELDVKEFPLALFDQKLDLLLGPTVDLLGTISLNEGNGSLDLALTSANLQTHIQGNLTDQGLTLVSPLNAKLHLTPEMSQMLLKDANPLFVTGISSLSPVNLQISPENSFFPYPFSLQKLQVGKATLDLGKVKCKNGESLQTIVSLLKADRLSDSSEMTRWFSPFAFQIDQGILTAGRLDALLADSIHICTWGQINLLNDQLNMVLGIPGDTLRSAFGLSELSDDKVLIIDIKGTTSHPEINKGAAAAKIAALIAKEGFKGPLAGVSDFFSSKESADVPPPNRPFPWER